MFVASELSSLLLNNYYYLMYRVGTRIQSVLTAAVYKKTMTLSNAARREKTVGEIVNLMAIDVQRFQDITTFMMLFWSSPLQVGLNCNRVLTESILGSALWQHAKNLAKCYA